MMTVSGKTRQSLQQLVGKKCDACERAQGRDPHTGELLLLYGHCGHGHDLLGDEATPYVAACANHWWAFVASLEDDDRWIRCGRCGHYCDAWIRAERPDGRYIDLHVAPNPPTAQVYSRDPEDARKLQKTVDDWQIARWKTGVSCR